SRAVTRFLHEAKIMNQLSHPNIIKIADFNCVGGIVYIVMDLLEGNTLKEEIAQLNNREQRLSYNDIFLILGKVCLATDTIHSQKIIHRDLKAENIFLTKNSKREISSIKVLDFGIALISGSRFTKMKQLIGSPEYMSPEHCDSKELNSCSDIYSLGIVLYEMLTGRVPFSIFDNEPLL